MSDELEGIINCLGIGDAPWGGVMEAHACFDIAANVNRNASGSSKPEKVVNLELSRSRDLN